MAELDYNCSSECLTAQNITSLPACWSTARKRVLDAIVALRNQICNFPCVRTVPGGTLPADFVDEGFGGELPEDCACPILTIIEGCNVWMGVNDASCNLGDGTDWFAVGLSPSGAWGAGELAFACDDTSGTEIYVDSAGKLRGEPPISISFNEGTTQSNGGLTAYALGTTVAWEDLGHLSISNPSLCRDAYFIYEVGGRLAIAIPDPDVGLTVAYVSVEVQIDGGGYAALLRTDYYPVTGKDLKADHRHLAPRSTLVAPGGTNVFDLRGVAAVANGGPIEAIIEGSLSVLAVTPA